MFNITAGNLTWFQESLNLQETLLSTQEDLPCRQEEVSSKSKLEFVELFGAGVGKYFLIYSSTIIRKGI